MGSSIAHPVSNSPIFSKALHHAYKLPLAAEIVELG